MFKYERLLRIEEIFFILNNKDKDKNEFRRKSNKCDSKKTGR